MLFSSRPPVMPTPTETLPGRTTPLATAAEHFVLHRPLKPPYPMGFEQVYFALGCFWGAERAFWTLGDGIWITAVGYQGGATPNPTYEEVCTGRTGHTESVLAVYDPAKIAFEALLKTFWESHDPTQGYRQGNDVGTQYRSAIFYTSPEQKKVAEEVKARVQASGKWKRPIVTQIVAAGTFTKAEDYHQDYLQKHPGGYTCHFLR